MPSFALFLDAVGGAALLSGLAVTRARWAKMNSVHSSNPQEYSAEKLRRHAEAGILHRVAADRHLEITHAIEFTSA